MSKLVKVKITPTGKRKITYMTFYTALQSFKDCIPQGLWYLQSQNRMLKNKLQMTIFGTRSTRTIQPSRTFDYNKKHHHWLHTLVNGGSLSGSKKCFNTSMPINKISIDFIRKHSDVKTTRLKGKTKDLFSVFQLFKVFLALQNHGLIHFKFVTKPLIDLSP